jgi:hypothetical protein
MTRAATPTSATTRDSGSAEYATVREFYAATYPRVSIGADPFVVIVSGRHGYP